MIVKNRFTGEAIRKFEISSGADLREANLSVADLSRADLSRADLSRADLSGADLSGADLSWANLSRADLSRADLRGANLSWANLSRADLSGADLSGADLSWANLSGANLSGANGLINSADLLSKFENDDLGVIVYKRVGGTDYNIPLYWTIEAGEFLMEIANPDRCTECGCGISFGTREFCDEYRGDQLWRCRIRWIDLVGVVVPYNTDGKARCERLELLERIA
jgi:uncharacterized protein YjbI with pentapeptide repeats